MPCFEADLNKKKKRGFGAMSPEKQKEIASKGGKSAHAMGKAHEFNSEEAKTAGIKGGLATSADREHMRKIGRMGGVARGSKHKARNENP